MDICLSVTKFHKEEWQAAWTSKTLRFIKVRGMLEALIAFFPVREDHDAIGAIDYPREARKKYAGLSRKYKCEVCGPIINLIPENHKGVKDAKDVKEVEVELEQHNVENKIQEEMLSSESFNSENKTEIRKSIKTRKRSISGVIVEDVNEDNEEVVEEATKPLYKSVSNVDQIVSPQIETTNDLKRTQSAKVDVTEYLKQLRRAQFATNAEEKDDTKEEKTKVEAEKVEPIKVKAKEEPVSTTDKSILVEKIENELEYLSVAKSLKYHQGKSKEEIQVELFEENLNRLLEEEKFTKGDKPDVLDLIEANKPDFTNMSSSRKRLEALVTKNVNVMKVLTKKAYKKEKDRKLLIVNVIFAVLSILVFVSYYYLRNNTS